MFALSLLGTRRVEMRTPLVAEKVAICGFFPDKGLREATETPLRRNL